MTTGDHLKKFKALSEELCALIEGEGLAVRPYDQPSLPYFQRLTSDEQKEAIHNLEDYLIIAKSVVEERYSLKDTAFFLEKALKHFGYEADPQIFKYIADDVLAEVYNSKHTQVFRGILFFEQATYTIEDFYSRQWLHLYDREGQVTQQLFGAAEQLFVEGKLQTIEPQVDEHILSEKASLLKVKSRVKVLAISLLFKDGKPAGLFSASRSHLIG